MIHTHTHAHAAISKVQERKTKQHKVKQMKRLSERNGTPQSDCDCAQQFGRRDQTKNFKLKID